MLFGHAWTRPLHGQLTRKPIGGRTCEILESGRKQRGSSRLRPVANESI